LGSEQVKAAAKKMVKLTPGIIVNKMLSHHEFIGIAAPIYLGLV